AARCSHHRRRRRRAPRAGEAVSDAWTIVLAVGIGTMVIKAAGPVLLGGRPLPERVQHVVAMLAPALLAALVATAALSTGNQLVFDARIIGLGAAALAILLRAPILAVVIIAALSAGLARVVGVG
ncbi:MAG: AzlD domain-containing protein, partial [Chloroflexota bacterium]|nr:AzlD domain-containing protein [Chloroflexota bacterium]